MDILEALNSGKLHSKARAARPDCVDAVGNIHHSAGRAAFVNWLMSAKKINGDDVNKWNEKELSDYKNKFVA